MPRSLAILLLALAPLAARAETITHTWTPRTEQALAAFEAGLERRVSGAGASVRQSGRGHEAEVIQSGSGNRSVVIQRGRGHEATVTQTGEDNAHVLIQVGRGGSAEVEQAGGEVGVTIQVSRPDRKAGPAPAGREERAEAER